MPEALKAGIVFKAIDELINLVNREEFGYLDLKEEAIGLYLTRLLDSKDIKLQSALNSLARVLDKPADELLHLLRFVVTSKTYSTFYRGFNALINLLVEAPRIKLEKGPVNELYLNVCDAACNSDKYKGSDLAKYHNDQGLRDRVVIKAEKFCLRPRPAIGADAVCLYMTGEELFALLKVMLMDPNFATPKVEAVKGLLPPEEARPTYADASTSDKLLDYIRDYLLEKRKQDLDGVDIEALRNLLSSNKDIAASFDLWNLLEKNDNVVEKVNLVFKAKGRIDKVIEAIPKLAEIPIAYKRYKISGYEVIITEQQPWEGNLTINDGTWLNKAVRDSSVLRDLLQKPDDVTLNEILLGVVESMFKLNQKDYEVKRFDEGQTMSEKRDGVCPTRSIGRIWREDDVLNNSKKLVEDGRNEILADLRAHPEKLWKDAKVPPEATKVV